MNPIMNDILYGILLIDTDGKDYFLSVTSLEQLKEELDHVDFDKFTVLISKGEIEECTRNFRKWQVKSIHKSEK